MIEFIGLMQLLRHKNPGNENVTENKKSKMSQHPAQVRIAHWIHCILALIKIYKSKAMKISGKKTTNSHLAEARRKLGFTQQQLATELGISRTMVVMVEQNKRNLSTDALLKLAALEMSRESLSIDPAPTTSTTRMPANYSHVRGRRTCTSLLIQEAASDLKCRRLKASLDEMLLQYERTVKWIAVLDGMDAGSSTIKRQREAAEAKLARNSLAAQAILKHEIALAEAQAELFRNMRGHINNELESGGKF